MTIVSNRERKNERNARICISVNCKSEKRNETEKKELPSNTTS
jgi:hypothetical protein